MTTNYNCRPELILPYIHMLPEQIQEFPEPIFKQTLQEFFPLSIRESQQRINEDDQDIVMTISKQIACIVREISIADQLPNAIALNEIFQKTNDFNKGGAAFKRDVLLQKMLTLVGNNPVYMAQARTYFTGWLESKEQDYRSSEVPTDKDRDVPYLFTTTIDDLQSIYPRGSISKMPHSLNLMYEFFRIGRYDIVEAIGSSGYSEGQAYAFYCWLLASAQEQRGMLTQAQNNFALALNRLIAYQSTLRSDEMEREALNLNPILDAFKISLREIQRKTGTGIQVCDPFFDSEQYPNYEKIIGFLRDSGGFDKVGDSSLPQSLDSLLDTFFDFIQSRIPAHRLLPTSVKTDTFPRSASGLTLESLNIRRRVSELMNSTIFSYLPLSLEHIVYDEFFSTDEGNSLHAIKAVIYLYRASCEKSETCQLLLKKIEQRELHFLKIYLAENLDELIQQYPQDSCNQGKMLLWMKKMANVGRYDLVQTIAALPIFKNCDLPVFFWLKAKACEESGNRAEAVSLYQEAFSKAQAGGPHSAMNDIYEFDVKRMRSFMNAETAVLPEPN